MKENGKENANAASPKRNYKDTVFRMLFKKKENLLSLYNALNKTAYTDIERLEVATLENAVYMNYKNDISFVFDYELMLYEHQSTVNPNMPLRDLIYVSKVLQGIVKDESLYGKTLVRLPAPRFVVFYNGADCQPEKYQLKLSGSFEKKQPYPELELIVTVYNINWGNNKELMKACRLLREYARYVEQVRIFAKTMPFPKAVEKAIDYCIEHEVLSEFLSKNRAEAIELCIFEFNEEKYMKMERENAYQDGIESGKKEGENKLLELFKVLTACGRSEDINHALKDRNYLVQLYEEYHL